jgi:hypothetical protein
VRQQSLKEVLYKKLSILPFGKKVQGIVQTPRHAETERPQVLFNEAICFKLVINETTT